MTSALLVEPDPEGGEHATDASPIGTRTPHESGIPPGGRYSDEQSFASEADAHVQLAIGESTRTEANLNLMLRGLQQLVSGVTNANETNLSLLRQLDAARELLAHGHAERMALTRRVRMLEDALACARGDAERERALFIEQEDAFLRELLTDHAREVADLARRLAATAKNSESAEEAESPALEASLPAPEKIEGRTDPAESGAAIAQVKLRAISVSVPEASGERPSVPRPSGPKPPLRQKPDPSTRPLIGYSLSSGEVAEERLEPERKSSRSSIPPPSVPPDTVREPEAAETSADDLAKLRGIDRETP